MGVVGQQIIRRIISDRDHQSLHSIVSIYKEVNLMGEISGCCGKMAIEIQQPLYFSPTATFFHNKVETCFNFIKEIRVRSRDIRCQYAKIFRGAAELAAFPLQPPPLVFNHPEISATGETFLGICSYLEEFPDDPAFPPVFNHSLNKGGEGS